MLNRNSSAKTNTEQSAKVQVRKSSPTIAKPRVQATPSVSPSSPQLFLTFAIQQIYKKMKAVKFLRNN